MKEMGVSRYNTVPKHRPYGFLYRCLHCKKDFPTRKKMKKKYACGDCCKTHGGGQYDARFKLVYMGKSLESLSLEG